MFVLVVEIEAKAGRSADLEKLLNGLVAVAKHEPGVLFYTLLRPLGESEKFVLCEYYEDMATWETHMRFPPVQKKLDDLELLLATAPKLTHCEMVSSTALPSPTVSGF